MKSMILAGVLATVAGSASAQIQLTRIAAIDFTGQLVGTNASSVAWDGTNLFVGGWNNAGSASDVGVTKLTNALSGSGTFSQFTVGNAAAFRGISGLAIRGNQLGVAVDTNGAAGVGNVQLRDTNGNLLFNSPADATSNGQSGVAFDPINGGLAYASFAAGRFRQFNTTDGSTIWSGATGPFNFDGQWGTAYRDTAIDASGNVYAREGAQLIKFTRNSPDGFEVPFTSSMILNGISDASLGDNSIGQNIGIIDDFGGVVLWNDRFSGSDAAADIIKAVGMDGSAVSLTFTNAASFFLNSTGIYDFSYDSATKTLAVAEWSSARVYIYSVVPAPGVAGLLGMAGLMAARRRR